MTKKSLNKLLSVILTLAICSATVFGCLITASAANVTCYEWSEGTASEDLTSATIDLTITAPAKLSDGISAGRFKLNADSALVLGKIEVTGGDRTDGSDFDVADFGDADENGCGDVASNDGTCLFEASEPYSSVTFKLTFSFAGGTALIGKEYSISIADSSLWLTGPHDGDFKYSGTVISGFIKTGCDHVFDVTGLTPITNTVEGYHVYTNVKCKNCDVVNEYQVVPATELKSVIYWDGTTEMPTAQDADGNYIISTAAELAWIVSRTDAAVTSGKSYKVADGIDAIVLQPESPEAKAIMDLADYAQTKAYFDEFGSKIAWVAGGSTVFAGNFDGNGAEIYGIYADGTKESVGLFGSVAQGVTVKNLAVKNSYVAGNTKVGALFGSVTPTAEGTVTVEKVIISGCHIKGNSLYAVGVMAGSTEYDEPKVGLTYRNCLVYSNHSVCVSDKKIVTSIVGRFTSNFNTNYEQTGNCNNQFENSIILDCVPYTLLEGQNNAMLRDNFVNIYTNAIDQENEATWPGIIRKNVWGYTWANYEGKIISVHRDDVKGDSSIIADLNTANGSTVWFAGANGGYPTFDKATAIVATDIVVYSGGGGVAPALLDPSAANSESNPYIIRTAENLLYIVKEGVADTAGKYYKVADNVKAFVLQPQAKLNAKGATVQDLMNLDAAGVKEWFFNPANEGTKGNFDFAIGNTGVSWQNWNKSSNDSQPFKGNFDGNGVTIYGMLCAQGDASLFGTVDNASIKNLNIKSSLIYGYQGGLIVSNTPGWDTDYTKTVSIKNCAISNSCAISWRPSTENVTTGDMNYSMGVLCGRIYNKVDFDGIVVHDVIAYNSYFDPKVGYSGNTLACIGYFTNTTKENISFKNSIIMGVTPYRSTYGSFGNNGTKIEFFNNIYSDCETNAVKWTNTTAENGYTVTYPETSIKHVTASQIKGAAAVTACPNLDWSVWSYDGNGGYPTPVPKGKIDTTSQYILNLKAVNIEYNIAYNTNGTFNFNFYYEPTVTGVTPVLYVGRADGSGFNKLTGTVITQDMIAATQAYQDAGLKAGTLRYTIGNISAREIGDTLLPTAVAKIGATTYFGKTEQISVADYAKSLIASADKDVTDGDKQVAAALVNYGTAAATALTTAAPSATATDIVVCSGGGGVAPALLDPSAANSESNPYIIRTAENLLYIVKEGVADTAGKYYKVADNVKAFVLQPQAKLNAKGATVQDLMNLDAAGVKEWFFNPANEGTKGNFDFAIGNTGVSWQNWNKSSNDSQPFKGNFDGNGVTIYGMLCAQGDASLFGTVDNASIKNLNIKSSLIYGYQGGLIVSNTPGWDTDYTKTVSIKNCAISNSCAISWRPSTENVTTGDMNYSMGVLCGRIYNKVDFDGIVVHDVIAYNSYFDPKVGYSGNTLACIGYFTNTTKENISFKNSIIMGVTPYRSTYGSFGNNGTKIEFFNNIYSDCETNAVKWTNTTAENGYTVTYPETSIKHVTASQIKGAAAVTACAGLDWANGWIIGSGNNYPSPVQTGATLNRAGKTIYWNGSATAPTSTAAGTAEDPIIINTAEELNYIATQINGTANGKWYKIADDISTIILQPKEVVDANYLMSLTDASKVKDYLKNLSGVKDWIPDSNEKYFNGNFDGNGVQIYGLYTVGKTNSGLFRCVDPWFATDGNAVFTENSKNYYVDTNFDEPIVFKNFAIKNSYYSSARRIGAVVAMTGSPNYGTNYTGAITIDKFEVSNCFMETTSTTAGHDGDRGLVTGGTGADLVRINNCLVYGNNAKIWTTGQEASLRGQVGTFKGTASAKNGNGFTWADGSVIENTTTNSIILGTAPYISRTGAVDMRSAGTAVFSKVYTDYDISNVSIGGNRVNYKEEQIKQFDTAADLIGEGGKATVDALNTANGTTVWYTGNEFDGYPSLKESSSMPNAYQAVYDAVEFTSYNSYTGSNDQFGLYTTSLNLKNNPYLSIVFAFGKEGDVNYKENRNAIQVKVTGASGKVLYDSEELDSEGRRYKAIPEYKEGEYISGVNGWTNKKNAGRFHTLKLDAPIYELCGELTVTITYGGKTVTNTVSVSGFGNELLNSYKRNPSDYYLNCAEAVKALLFYTQSLKARYGTKA